MCLKLFKAELEGKKKKRDALKQQLEISSEEAETAL